VGRAIRPLELGQKNEGLDAQRASLRLADQVSEDRASARPFARGMLRTSRRQATAMTLAAFANLRQAQRLLGKLSRDRPRSALGRQPRRLVEHGGDTAI